VAPGFFMRSGPAAGRVPQHRWVLLSDGNPAGAVNPAAPPPITATSKVCAVAPGSSASSPTPRRCCGWPARCSSKPTTNGTSPTNAISPKPHWRCSSHATNPRKPLHPQLLSRHSEHPQSLRRNARPAYTTPRGTTDRLWRTHGGSASRAPQTVGLRWALWWPRSGPGAASAGSWPGCRTRLPSWLLWSIGIGWPVSGWSICMPRWRLRAVGSWWSMTARSPMIWCATSSGS
jgi:hypothetical protein